MSLLSQLHSATVAVVSVESCTICRALASGSGKNGSEKMEIDGGRLPISPVCSTYISILLRSLTLEDRDGAGPVFLFFFFKLD